MNQYYEFTHINILMSQNADEAVEAKEYFEAYAEYHGADINIIMLQMEFSEVHYG